MADPKHHAAGIAPAFAQPPHSHLFGEISGRLPGKGRVGRVQALALAAMARGAGQQAASRVALMIEREEQRRHRTNRLKMQAGVVGGRRATVSGAQLAGDPAHFRVVAATVRIGVQLPFQVARIQASEARGTGAIPTPVEPVAGEAGVGRAGRGAAVRNHPPVVREAIERSCLSGATPPQEGRGAQEKEIAHRTATSAKARLFPLAALAVAALALAACKPPPGQRQFVATANAQHGKVVIKRVGCGSCHAIPGVGWPQGKVGPGLDGLADRALIAGKLPNQPDVLAGYIRDAPALVPDSAMPAMPVSEAEARDIAAYLYEQGAS